MSMRWLAALLTGSALLAGVPAAAQQYVYPDYTYDFIDTMIQNRIESLQFSQSMFNDMMANEMLRQSLEDDLLRARAHRREWHTPQSALPDPLQQPAQ